MSAAPDPRLQRLLGGPELASVRRQLRRRFETVGPDAPPTTARVDKLDPDAHRALCQLTGQPSRLAQSMTLDITALDANLRAAGLAGSLRDALERLEGPIVAHAHLRRERQAEWSALLADFAAGLRLREWLGHAPNARALLKRLGREPQQARQLLAAADAVLNRLPAAGIPRSQLAAETLGDAHALDAGKAVAAVVLRAWRWHEHVDGVVADRDGGGDPDTDAPGSNGDGEDRDERLRDVWARAGVMISELARPVLFLNLPLPAGGRFAWIPGIPGYLSLRQLLRDSPAWPVAGRRIHVCENPDIVAIAADQLGETCAPLVCTDGMPAASQRILLDQLVAAGAHLYYHGDYDWPGIGIGNFVMRTWSASPWRFGATEYRVAVERVSPRPRDLGTARVEAIWDAGLATVMDEYGLVVAEEALITGLLDELRQDAGP